MDPERWERIAQIYEELCERPASEHDRLLARACGADESLRCEVESLLRQDISRDGPLERAAESVVNAGAVPRFIGPYRILRLVGEGGMGAVYEAEQDHPRRTVALKVIKSAFASPELLRRFVLEAEALGRLQHPGIARIYEAGAADTSWGSQPYFVMEFIRGESLLKYAGRERLDTRRRLELMIKVCDAVDHAHQRGIIHRDLKPANILVDETGQPKVLDFGVARMADSEANASRQTSLGDLVGTLAYMSPEQLTASPVEERTDVYSLGVILYELLAGRRPYEPSREWPEAAHVIREQDPPPLGKVNRAYHGDLETVAAKALEKDRERRYGSPGELAADLRRYLAHEPISARPASTVYRARKFIRRHGVLVGATTAIFAVLVAGIAVSAWQAIRANRERDRALRAEQVATAVNDFLQNDLLAQAGARAQAGTRTTPDPDLKVRTALDRAAGRIRGRFDAQPAVEASIRRTIGLAYFDLSIFPDAQLHLERAVELRKRALGPEHPDTLTSMDELGVLYNLQGKYAAAEGLLSQVLEARRRLLGGEHRDTLATMSDLALAISYEGDDARAASIFEKVLDAYRRIQGEAHPATLGVMDNLASTYARVGRYPEAAPLFERELELSRRVLGPQHPDTLNSMHNLATAYRSLGKYADADRLFNAALDARRRVLGEEHWETQNSLYSLALSYRAQGRYVEAEKLFKQAGETLAATLGPEQQQSLRPWYYLAEMYERQGRLAEAAEIFNRVLGVRRRDLGPGNQYTAQALSALGEVRLDQGAYIEAEKLLREASRIRAEKAPDRWERYYTDSMLGASLARLGRQAEARMLLNSGYQGMLEHQSSMPAEYRPLLDRVRQWRDQLRSGL